MLDTVADHKWSPVTRLSNEDYAKILDNKKLKLDVDIALIDDRIAKLRETAAQAVTIPPQSVRDGPSRHQRTTT